MKKFDLAKQSMIASFWKESQMDRSLRNQEKSKFKRELFSSILRLVKKVDDNKLNNRLIRNEIKRVAKRGNVSIGQAQKVINVYLKYYCILTKQVLKVIKELDSPLDSRIINKFKNKELKKTSLRSLKDFNVYEEWQAVLEKDGKGIRILPDLETYDKNRIKEFFIDKK